MELCTNPAVHSHVIDKIPELPVRAEQHGSSVRVFRVELFTHPPATIQSRSASMRQELDATKKKIAPAGH